MRIAVIVACILGFAISVNAYVILAIHHIDTGGLTLFIGGAATFLIPQLVTLVKTHSMQQSVEQVKQQTNGPITQVAEKVDSIAETLQANGNGVEK